MTSTAATKLIAEPLSINGKVAPNRLAKAAMEECLAKTKEGLPNENHFNLYRAWAKAGWGIILTGNVAIDNTHLGTPWDITLPRPPYGGAAPAISAAFKKYADAATGRDSGVAEAERPLVIVQLVHAGRQSMRGSGRPVWKPALAPSAVPMATSGKIPVVGKVIDWTLFGRCAAMTREQIHEQIEMFASAAELMDKSGFDGVEIHGSHGYQVAAFLSPRTNVRTDEYGGSAEGRFKFLKDIIAAVRKRVSKNFIVGVKLNSSDYVAGGLTEEDALQNLTWLDESGQCDFVEISGGNYENPGFMTDGFDADAETAKLRGGAKAVTSSSNSAVKKPSARTFAREALFQTFAKRARETLPASSKMTLIVTGGMKTRTGMASALSPETGIDSVGIGRLAAVYPDLPKRILDASLDDLDPKASPPPYKVPGASMLAGPAIAMLGAGWSTFWHSGMMSFVSRNEPVEVNASSVKVLVSTLAPSVLKMRLGAIFVALIVGFLALFAPVLGMTQKSKTA